MPEIVIGLVAVALAAIALVGVVRELASRVGLNGLDTMLLAGLLGMGVLAFTEKLVAVVVLEAAPVTLVQQQISPPSQKRTEDNCSNAESIEPMHYVWRTLPKSAPAPADNPTTPAKARLGERLFHDVNLSADRDISSLEEAVRIMAETQLGLKIDQQIRSVAARQDTGHAPGVTLHRGRTLTIQDIDAIVAFLRTLSSDRLVSTAR